MPPYLVALAPSDPEQGKPGSTPSGAEPRGLPCFFFLLKSDYVILLNSARFFTLRTLPFAYTRHGKCRSRSSTTGRATQRQL